MKKIFLLVSFFVFGFGFGQNQTIFKDPSFQSPNLTYFSYSNNGFYKVTINDITNLDNGKILVSGLFNNYNGEPVSSLIRLNEDGSLDPTFNFITNINNQYTTVLKTFVQYDNKIIALVDLDGSSTGLDIIRLMPDGEIDLSYNTSRFDGIESYVFLEEQNDHKLIVVNKNFQPKINGVITNQILRLNIDGTIDQTFSMPTQVLCNFDLSSVKNVKIDFNNKIVIVGLNLTPSCQVIGYTKIIRLNENGSIDSTFSQPESFATLSTTIVNLCFQNDNKIILEGSFTIGNDSSNKIVRLNNDGTMDSDFNTGIYSTIVGNLGYIKNIIVQNDNKIIVYGNGVDYNNLPVSDVFRLNQDGVLDASFNFDVTSFGENVNRVDSKELFIKTNGNILVGGHFSSNLVKITGLLEINSNGSLNLNFSNGTGFRYNCVINKIEQLSSGKILIGGAFDTVNGVVKSGIARLNEDGTLDTSFGNSLGFFSSSDALNPPVVVSTFAIQPDGKIIVAGSRIYTYDGVNSYGVVRLNENGTIDNTFNVGYGTLTGSGVSSIAIQLDGKIILGGSFSNYQNSSGKYIVRLNADGSVDNTFNIGVGFNSNVTKIKLQTDQKILVLGAFTKYNNVTTGSPFLRLNTNGTRDMSFNSANFYIFDSNFDVSPNGKIYINRTYSLSLNPVLERLNNDGSVDTTFNCNISDNKVLDFCFQPDDKILITTVRFVRFNNALQNISRLDIDGSLDTSFDIGMGFTKNSYNNFYSSPYGNLDFEYRAVSRSLFMQNDGKLLIGGYFTHYNNEKALGTIRLLNIDSYNLKGQNKLDQNNNGCDATDFPFRNLKFQVSNVENNFNYIANNTGNYNIGFVGGNHTITPTFENPSYFTASPISVSVSFPTQPSPVIQDFCITPNGVHPDLEITLLPLTVARPGFQAKYRLVYKNKGNQLQSGTVNFNFNDAVLNFVSATTAISSQTLNNLNWNFTNLMPLETREITITLNVNSPTSTPPVASGFVLNYTTSVSSTLTDEMPSDNTFTFNQTVVNSFDPNDKTCLEGASIATTKVGDYVHYMIRFENTGSYNAQNITVKDVIDTTKYDINTLLPTSGSHPFITRILEGNRAEFYFENINLPFADATNDGYVAFKIKTKSTLVAGDSFSNSAGIYFDYNYPITTNTATTTITALSSQDFTFNNYFSIYPNPVENNLNISKKEEIEISSITIYNMLGQIVVAIPNAKNVENVDVSSLKSGNYFVKINTDKGNSNTKFIKL